MFQVGQVLYVISQKRQQVYPVRVVEQVVRKSLEGETVSYQVEIPSKDDESKRYELSRLGPNVHSNLSKVRALLMKTAAVKIDELVTLASEMAQTNFGVTVLPLSDEADPDPDEDVEIIDDRPVDNPFLQDDEKIKITLPDGSVANVNLNSMKTHETGTQE